MSRPYRSRGAARIIRGKQSKTSPHGKEPLRAGKIGDRSTHVLNHGAAIGGAALPVEQAPVRVPVSRKCQPWRQAVRGENTQIGVCRMRKKRGRRSECIVGMPGNRLRMDTDWKSTRLNSSH